MKCATNKPSFSAIASYFPEEVGYPDRLLG
jgi:hypothetical protein